MYASVQTVTMKAYCTAKFTWYGHRTPSNTLSRVFCLSCIQVLEHLRWTTSTQWKLNDINFSNNNNDDDDDDDDYDDDDDDDEIAYFTVRCKTRKLV